MRNFTKFYINNDLFSLRLEAFYLYIKILNKIIRFHKEYEFLNHKIFNMKKSSFYRCINKLILKGFLQYLGYAKYKAIEKKINGFQIIISNEILNNIDLIFSNNKKELRFYIFLIRLFHNKYNEFIDIKPFIKMKILKKNLKIKNNNEIDNFLEFLKQYKLIEIDKNDKFNIKLIFYEKFDFKTELELFYQKKIKNNNISKKIKKDKNINISNNLNDYEFYNLFNYNNKKIVRFDDLNEEEINYFEKNSIKYKNKTISELANIFGKDNIYFVFIDNNIQISIDFENYYKNSMKKLI